MSRRRWVAPYLADTYWAEGLALAIGLASFFATFVLQDSSGTAAGALPRAALPIVVGLLATLVVDSFLDKAVSRSRRTRLEQLEVALSDKNIADYMNLVVSCYRAAAVGIQGSNHPELYDERVRSLLQGEEWKALRDSKIEIRDPQREFKVALELLPGARKTLHAIAIPKALDYQESEQGHRHLEEQRRRIKRRIFGPRQGRLHVERVFTYSAAEAAALHIDVSELKARIERIALVHHKAGVECKIVDLDKLSVAHGIPDVDIDIYDDHTVRFSTLQVGGGQMLAVISENVNDLQNYSQLFYYLWASSPLWEPKD